MPDGTRTLPPFPKQGMDLRKMSGTLGENTPTHPSGDKLILSMTEGPFSPREGIFYSYMEILESKNGSRKRYTRYEIYRFDPEAWSWGTNPWGTLTTNRNIRVCPVSAHVLVAMANRPAALQVDGKPHVFARFTRNAKGEFELSGPLDDGLEGGAFEVDGWGSPVFDNLSLGIQAVWADRFLVLGSGHGLFWIFDEKGAMRRLVRLYKGLDNESLKKGLIWQDACRAFQPTKEGELLIVSLPEPLLTRGALLMKERMDKEGIPSMKVQELLTQSVLQDGAQVEWSLLDPESGKVVDAPPPAGMPSHVKSPADLGRLQILFEPDGRVKNPKAPAAPTSEPQLKGKPVPAGARAS